MDEEICSTSAAAFDAGPVVGTTVTGKNGNFIKIAPLLTRRLQVYSTLKHCHRVSLRYFIDGTAPCTRLRNFECNAKGWGGP